MHPLPGKLAKPLHVIPEWVILIFTVLKWIFIIITISILLFFLIKYLKKKKKQRSYIVKDTSAQSYSINLRSLINQILQEKDYRKGCFLLSKELKTYMEQKSNINVEEMTIDELLNIFKSKKIGKYLKKLRKLQYQRQEPSKADFLDIADRSDIVFKSQLKKEYTK